MRLSKLIIFLICMTFISCDKEYFFKVNGNALGTTYNVSYYAQEKQNFQPKFDSLFNAINNSISTYVETSDLSRFNKGEDVVVDKHFEAVFNSSKYLNDKTDGYFDPSIGIMVNAYGFGPEDYDLDISKSTVDSLMQFVGLEHFEYRDSRIRTDLNQYFLDFNANGKGYAVDVIANYLKEKGITNFFVEIGGEISASGYNKSKDQPWTFGIEQPSEENTQRDLSYAIILNEKAMATSGNYRKFRTDEATGLKFVHTINPKTGLAEKSDVLGASVVADDCMTADGYATAFMAMGFEKAKSAIEKHNISALLIYADSNNEIQTYITSDLEEAITEF